MAERRAPGSVLNFTSTLEFQVTLEVLRGSEGRKIPVSLFILGRGVTSERTMCDVHGTAICTRLRLSSWFCPSLGDKNPPNRVTCSACSGHLDPSIDASPWHVVSDVDPRARLKLVMYL